jgi:hypothetical protein
VVNKLLGEHQIGGLCMLRYWANSARIMLESHVVCVALEGLGLGLFIELTESIG